MPFTAEYIWLDSNSRFRSKARVLQALEPPSDSGCCEPSSLPRAEDLPNWNYDGSSTGQAEGHRSEIVIKPRAVFYDPFRRHSEGILVVCDTYDLEDKPLSTNWRSIAKEIFDRDLEQEPWFGLEQEYFLVDPKTKKPLGFPEQGEPPAQGPYYCGVGKGRVFGREVVEEHMRACLYAGVQLSGINAEVAPGQWEFQVGPCTGIDCGDHMFMARYLLERVAEDHNVEVDWSPKPLSGDWNGSGCHVNYSTKWTREGNGDKTGLEIINQMIERLRVNHLEHMTVYGEGNELRLTGLHETAKYSEFSSGEADRGASIRIGNDTVKAKKGYFEDRRPASNIDPYLVSSKIFETTVLKDMCPENYISEI